MFKRGRNQPCPCGSGRKLKRCCGAPGSRGPFGLPGETEPYVVELMEVPAWASRTSPPGRVDTPLRMFEISKVEAGLGVWAVELKGRRRRGEPFWIEDQEASFVLAPGNCFGICLEPGEPIQIPPFWEGCPHCAELKRQRRAGGR
jgi:hypothetical protein